MKVLGINGSPRIGANTDILLDKVLDGARSTRHFIDHTLGFTHKSFQ